MIAIPFFLYFLASQPFLFSIWFSVGAAVIILSSLAPFVRHLGPPGTPPLAQMYLFIQ